MYTNGAFIFVYRIKDNFVVPDSFTPSAGGGDPIRPASLSCSVCVFAYRTRYCTELHVHVPQQFHYLQLDTG